jgi:hypothetical protein
MKACRDEEGVKLVRTAPHRTALALALNSLGVRKGGLAASASAGEGSKKGPAVEVLKPTLRDEARRGKARLGAPGKKEKKSKGKIHYARYHPMGMRHAHPRGVNVERIIYFAFVLVVLEKLWVYVIMAPACDRNAPHWQAPPLSA